MRLSVKIQDLVQGWHRDDSGAIVLLCLAACLFLFMVGLLMYDTGQVARDKVDVQMAADTAAYSQASVQARAMNSIAFANVGKRTITGIRNMYYTQFYHYFKWYRGQCKRCCCGFWCGCWGACLNCAGNTLSLVPFLGAVDSLFFTLARLPIFEDKMTKHLKALDKFQAEMAAYAPYWALGEGVVRGARNGAHAVTTYPLPKTPTFGPLPVKKSSGFGAAIESCLFPTYFFNPSSMGTITEMDRNFAVLKRNSVSRPYMASKGPREVVSRFRAAEGCMTGMMPSFLFPDNKYAPPYHLTADGNSGSDYMKRSNIVWTYRYTPDMATKLRDNYNAVLSKDYTTDIIGLPHSGMWAMSRGEMYYREKNDPNFVKGPNAMWMFHPSWIGKLRPVLLKNERLPVDPSDMWAESRGLALRQAPLFGVDLSDFGKDLLYMEKATLGMDGKIEGKEVLDGIAK